MGNSRTYDLIQTMKKQDIQALIVQGTRQRYSNDIKMAIPKSNPTDETEYYEIFMEECGADPPNIMAGVAIFLSPTLKHFLKKKLVILKHRILAIHASNRDHSIFFISAYCPGEDRPPAEKTQFWKSLNNFLSQLAKKHSIILSIDTNGHIGSDPPTPYIATGGNSKWTTNGHAFADFCLTHQLHATNSLTDCKNTGSTWTKRGDTHTKHRLDYICVNLTSMIITENLGSISALPWMMQGAMIDHNPVQVNLSIKAHCIKYNRQGPKTKTQTLRYSKTTLQEIWESDNLQQQQEHERKPNRELINKKQLAKANLIRIKMQ
jgi:hypothetical protein